jgi:hypothetical protein
VLGDHWTSTGDPRGELIAIGHGLAKNPTHKALRSAWTRWMVEHARALWGEHGITQHCLRDVDWYMGFIRACTVTEDYRVDMPALVATVLDDPGPGRFVQRLAITGSFELATVVARRPRPTLRELALGHPGGPGGDLSGLWPAVTELRTLELEGSGAILGALHAPRLEHFAFDFSSDAVDVAFLAPLWAGEGVPALRELALTNCSQTDALCDALVQSPIARQLRAIDFSYGTMTAAGAAILVEHRDKLAGVERWNFELNYLTPAACEALRVLSGAQQLGDQRDDHDGHRHGADWE